MVGTVFTNIVGTQNARQYAMTQTEVSSVLGGLGVVTFSSLTQALAPYLLISSLPGSLASYVTSASLAATLATFPALSGNNVWTGKQEFKDLPWADVTAYGATGNGVTNDTVAIQAAIDHMNGVYAGGFVFLPPGNYVTSSVGLTVKSGVILMGSGRKATFVNGTGQDNTVVTFDNTCAYAELRDLEIGGYLNSLATKPATTIANGVVVDMRNTNIFGGTYAIATGGVDGRNYNVFAMGYTGAVFTTGGNFWTDCKFDDPGGFNPLYAMNFSTYYAGNMVVEDQILDTDLGGNLASILINDTNQKRRCKFIGCLPAAPISVLNHGWTLLNGCEIGQPNGWTLTTTNPITVIGCYQQGGTATLAGSNVILSGNYNIVP